MRTLAWTTNSGKCEATHRMLTTLGDRQSVTHWSLNSCTKVLALSAQGAHALRQGSREPSDEGVHVEGNGGAAPSTGSPGSLAPATFLGFRPPVSGGLSEPSLEGVC